MPSLYEMVGHEVMSAIHRPTAPNLMERNDFLQTLSGTGYSQDLYLNNRTSSMPNLELDFLRKYELNKKQSEKNNQREYNISRDILYRAAFNPSKN